MTAPPTLTPALFAEILRDSHGYTPGIEQRRPKLLPDARPPWRRSVYLAREHARDSLERVAARAGFSHSHFDPDRAGDRLARLAELSDGLEQTYAWLGDDASRRALIDVLKCRVLGPYHARLAITPQGFRDKQAWLDREHRLAAGTFTVADPGFPPLSLYRVPVDGCGTVELHTHSIGIVGVFLLEQYGYACGSTRVRVEPGDVVFDAGGCWGDTALYFASLVGPRGKVYTFEFDPESLDILRANLALNPTLADRIQVVERALWDRSEERLPFVQAASCTTVRDGHAGDDELTVATITVDDFVREAGLERVDFIKMDVEGAELRVIGGAGETFERSAPKLAIAAYHKDDDLVRLPQEICAGQDAYRLYLGSYSAVEEETVLFALTQRSSST